MHQEVGHLEVLEVCQGQRNLLLCLKVEVNPEEASVGEQWKLNGGRKIAGVNFWIMAMMAQITIAIEIMVEIKVEMVVVEVLEVGECGIIINSNKVLKGAMVVTVAEVLVIIDGEELREKGIEVVKDVRQDLEDRLLEEL